MKELPAIVSALLAPNAQAGVLATLVAVEGSSYRRPGARLLINAEQSRIGSISGGWREQHIIPVLEELGVSYYNPVQENG